METITLADLGLCNSSSLPVAIPVVDAVPTVATMTSPPPWEDPPSVVAAPIWTSADVEEPAPMEVDKPKICVVALPTSSFKLYESVITL